MSILDTDFLLSPDKEIVKGITSRVFRAWGEHTQSLVDCVQYYTLVLEGIRGPAITDPPCQSRIDLRLVCEVVDHFPGQLRDFRLEWGETTFHVEFDLFKHTTEERVYPDIEWVEYDTTVFERRLEEKRITFLEQPSYWGDILPMLKAIVKTIYNKAKHSPAFEVDLGVEPQTESCFLTFSHMDHVSYAVLSRIAEQSHILDMNVTVWEKRLDIRVKLGKATPWPERSLGPKKHTLVTQQQEEDRPAKRTRR